MTSRAEQPQTPDMTISATSPARFLNREQSWLAFNWRVLEEAMNERQPLLERAKFLAIFNTNLDEYFMIRVAGLKQQIAAHVTEQSNDGMTPAEQLAAIRRVVLEHQRRYEDLWLHDIRPKLCEQGIQVLDYTELDAGQRSFCRDYFEREVFPVLTPLAFDPSHPFPHISNLSLNLAVVINDPEEGELFARVKVPAVLPRLIRISGEHCTAPSTIPPERRYCYTWLDQVIAENVEALFPGVEVAETYAFRIIRNADMEIQEEEAGDLLRTIEQGVRQRRFGATVAIAVEHDTPPRIRELLLTNLKLTADDLYESHGPLGLSDLMTLMGIDRPDLKDAPFYPHIPTPLRHARASAEYFGAIRQQDILLHHPYDSFQPVAEMIQLAAEDPDVLAIKQTLYRSGRNSPIVEALMHAREQDKQVTVLVELKARFDEENNIVWARALERAGVHVVYGLMGLKTHAKLSMIVRREQDSLRRYVHLGTGNYNAATSRIYTDLGLLTANPAIGMDVSNLFNFLTGYSRLRNYQKLLVAPFSLRERLTQLIDRETTHAREGRNGHIIIKCNALVDAQMIDRLYRASQSGVRIELVVRGICCLRPGVPGLSEHITVRSIVGRFLEHSRIYYFGNNGSPEVYLGSADLMSRNLDRRVETLFPLEDARHIEQMYTLLQTYLRDNVHARVLQPDGHYTWAATDPGRMIIDSQAFPAGDHDVLPEPQ